MHAEWKCGDCAPTRRYPLHAAQARAGKMLTIMAEERSRNRSAGRVPRSDSGGNKTDWWGYISMQYQLLWSAPEHFSATSAKKSPGRVMGYSAPGM